MIICVGDAARAMVGIDRVVCEDGECWSSVQKSLPSPFKALYVFMTPEIQTSASFAENRYPRVELLSIMRGSCFTPCRLGL